MKSDNSIDGWIGLTGVSIRAFHGIYDIEKEEGNEYEVNIKIKTNLRKAIGSDQIEDAVNYEILADIVKEAMANRRSLIETVADDILARLFQSFPKATKAWVQLRKMAPSMEIPSEASFVSLSRTNPQKAKNKSEKKGKTGKRGKKKKKKDKSDERRMKAPNTKQKKEKKRKRSK